MKRLDLKKDFFHDLLGNYVFQQFVVKRPASKEKATAIPLIPKNASTTLRHRKNRENWSISHWMHTSHSDFEEIGILFRDPYQRWISGVTEYCYRFNLDPKILNFDQIIFDGHTVAQSDYLYQINPKISYFFMIEDDGVNKINTAYNVFKEVYKDNATEDKLKKSGVRDIILDRINKNYESKVKDYYKKDYIIMDKYYG